MTRPLKIVGLGGSLAEVSRSRAALRVALAGAEETGAETELLDLRELDLPMYSPGAEPGPEATHLIEACYSADGLVWSSPMYQGTISGAFKNALDWLVGGVEIVGKPIAVVNAMPRATLAHAALVETLRVMGGRVVAEPALPLAGRRLDAGAIATDPELSALLIESLSALARAAVEAPDA